MSAWEALLALWLALPEAKPYDPPLPAFSGSIVRTADTHLGVRASTDGSGAAISLQLTATVISL